MHPYLENLLYLCIYIFFILRTMIKWILYPFRPVWYLLYILVLPFLHAGEAIWAVFSYPARVFPGSLAETLWIYLSTAAVIGVVTGGLLVLTHQLLTSLLRLNSPSYTAAPARPAKRSMKDYRAARRQKKDSIKYTRLTDIDTLDEMSSANLSPTMTDAQLKWARKSLVTSPGTILEEGSDDDYF